MLDYDNTAELPNPILTRDQNDNTPSSNIMLPAIEAPAEDISIHECIRQGINEAHVTWYTHTH